MTALKKEFVRRIEFMPDKKLKALKPLFDILMADELVYETDLTEKEKAIIREGREEYKKGTFVPLSSIL